MQNQNRLRIMFWQRAISALIDILFISCISYIVRLLIIQFIFIDSFTVFAIIWFLYYSVCYIVLKGRTLAKVITGLQVIATRNEEIGAKHIIIREVVCKFIILLIIPAFLLNGIQIYEKSHILLTIAFIIALVITTTGILLLFKKTWWELLSRTKTTKNIVTHKTLRLISFIAIVSIFIITIFVKIYPIIKYSHQLKTTFYPKYPVNSETRKYASFIKTHSQDPVDYIFGLFEKYDLVVLSERMHPEYTQYELISKIISDKRFADKIGNIYTECGSISFQDTLNNYLNTVFTNEDSLNKATALLQRNSNSIWPLWGITNLFDLLKLVNKLNSNSVDSLKINWYFTDIPVNWETMTPTNYLKQVQNENRDKIMADHIIHVYENKVLKNERRKKGLVIMNFRHGYGLIRDDKGKKTNHPFNTFNTTAFLMDSLQNIICNIMINTVSMKYGIIFTPIQNGKWDRAFSIIGNPDFGLDFVNSPFGQDKFDGFIGNPSNELKYKDVFTGFIFYKPLEQHVKKEGFPYMLYNFEDSLLRRAKCVSLSQVEVWNNGIKYFKKTIVSTEPLPYAFFYNLITNVGLPVVILLALILSILLFY
jgi:hypothetical protein